MIKPLDLKIKFLPILSAAQWPSIKNAINVGFQATLLEKLHSLHCFASFLILKFHCFTNLQKKLFITHSIPVYAVSTLFDRGRQPSSCSPVLVFARRTACMLCHVHCTVYVSNRNVLKTSFPHKSRKTFQFLYRYTVCTLIGCTLYIYRITFTPSHQLVFFKNLIIKILTVHSKKNNNQMFGIIPQESKKIKYF